VHAVSAALALAELLAGLQVDVARCRSNIESLNGLVFAERLAEVFTPALGKTDAQVLVSELCRRAASEHRHLRDLALERSRNDPRLVACTAADIEAAFDLGRATQASTALVEPTLRCARAPETNDD
jgi:3-carboxy-cis,cis-muconate cycloisomerase